jgi:predicted ATPase
VLIVGEPGLGKSRLIEEFRGRLGETPHTWVEWRASQLLQNTPLHPIAEWGRQRFCADGPGRTATRRPRRHSAPHRPRPRRKRAPARAASRHSATARPRG